MEIKELKEATEAELTDINSLLRQLVHDPSTYAPISLETLQKIVSDADIAVVAAREGGKIVGIGFLYIVIKPRGHYAYLEDMMVDGEQQGKGIGEAIGRQLIASAKKRGVGTIELSARPSRVAANKLYQKLGFEHKDTNVYRMKL
ncbi:MAG: GNAT family N-acetyltransferase [bacterium]|nr:GNAT family N-acetyltransferase [bacterium]